MLARQGRQLTGLLPIISEADLRLPRENWVKKLSLCFGKNILRIIQNLGEVRSALLLKEVKSSKENVVCIWTGPLYCPCLAVV